MVNCAACGRPLPNGATVCPYCGQPVNAYQQSYAQYQPGQYPPGYQQPYAYGQQPSGENGLLTAIAELPRAFANSFTRPGEVLHAMVERRDLATCPMVTALVLTLCFLAGMVIMRSFLGLIVQVIASFAGVTLAQTDASMNQGVSYIAGRVGPAVGGIAALCQFISMIVPTVAFILYICLICKVTFSWELLLGFLAVTSLPTAAVALAAMALALLSPWLALVPILCGTAVSYVQMSGMLSLITGRPEAQLVRARVCLTVISLALTLLLCGFIGGLLMNGVMQRVMILLSNVGSLI